MVVVYAAQELLGYLTPRGVYLAMGGLDSAFGGMKTGGGAMGEIPHTFTPKQGMAPASLSFPNRGAAKAGIGAMKDKASFSPAPSANLSDDDEDDWIDDGHESPEHQEPNCPMCEGPGQYLGHLGSRAHFRCKHCGMGFSHDEKDNHRAHFSELTAEDRKRLSKKEFGIPRKNKPSGFPMPDKEHARLAISGASRSEHAGNISPSTEAKIDAKAHKVLGGDKTAHDEKTAKMSDSVSPSDADKDSADIGMDMAEDEEDEKGGKKKKKSGKTQDQNKTLRFYEDHQGDYHTRLGENWNLTINGKKGEPKTHKMSSFVNPEFKRHLQEVSLSEVPTAIVATHKFAWGAKLGAKQSHANLPGNMSSDMPSTQEKTFREKTFSRSDGGKGASKPQLSEQSLRTAGYTDSDLAYLGLDPKALAPNGAVGLAPVKLAPVKLAPVKLAPVKLAEGAKDGKIHSVKTTKADKKTPSQYDAQLVNLEDGPFPGSVMACPACGTERKPSFSFGGYTRVECPNCGQSDYVYNHDATGDQGYDPLGVYTKVSDGVGKHQNPDKGKFASMSQFDRDNE